MAESRSFDEVLDAIEHLPDEQQADLVDLIRRRLADRARQRIASDAVAARKEFADGKLRPVSVEDLMRDIES